MCELENITQFSWIVFFCGDLLKPELSSRQRLDRTVRDHQSFARDVGAGREHSREILKKINKRGHIIGIQNLFFYFCAMPLSGQSNIQSVVADIIQIMRELRERHELP